MLLIVSLIKVSEFNVPKDTKTKETESKNALNLPEGANLTLLAPIDHCTKGNISSLKVTIPSSMKSITSTDSFWEFIPSEESADNWSEIFTVKIHLAIEEYADLYNQHLLKVIGKASHNLKILHEADKTEKAYMVSTFAATYEVNGKKELLLSTSYSGPKDLTNVQITRRLKEKDQPEVVLKEMQKDLKDRLMVVPFKIENEK